MPTESPEPYLTAKELADEFRRLRIRPCSYEAALAIIRACPYTIGHCLRLSDALNYFRACPGWRPLSENPEKARPILTQPELPGIRFL